MKHFILSLVFLLITSFTLYASNKETPQYKLIYHNHVTLEQFKQICKQEKITHDLSKWIEISITFNDKEVTQWIYVKGKNGNKIATLTKYSKQNYYKLDIQIKQKEPKK